MERQGLTPEERKEYDRALKPHLDEAKGKAERGEATNVPKDLDPRPYEQSRTAHLLPGLADHGVPELEGKDAAPVPVSDTYPGPAVWERSIGALRRVVSRAIGKPLRPGEYLPGKLDPRTRQTIGAIAKLFNQRVVVFRHGDKPTFPIDGVVIRGGTIYINANTKSPHLAVMMHELTHSMARDAPDLYRELRNAVVGNLKDSDQYEASRMGGTQNTPSQIHEEMIADHASDPAFWKDLADRTEQRSPGLWPKVARWIGDTIGKISGKARPFASDKFNKDFDASRDAVLSTLTNYSERARKKLQSTRGEESAGFSRQPRDEHEADDRRRALPEVRPGTSAAAQPQGSPGNAGRGLGRDGQPLEESGWQNPDYSAPSRRGTDLKGLPSRIKQKDRRVLEYQGFKPAQDAAKAYMAKAGLPYDPPKTYAKVDPERANKVADALNTTLDRDPLEVLRRDCPERTRFKPRFIVAQLQRAGYCLVKCSRSPGKRCAVYSVWNRSATPA